MSNRKYSSVFKKAFTVEYPCIIASRKGDTYAFCSICRSDFSVLHKGKGDIANHVRTQKHVDAVKCVERNQVLNFTPQNSSSDDVIRAECMFTTFLVEHNIPLSCADHASVIFKKMFPDSNIAKKYSCARTKTACIVSEMGSSSKKDLIQLMQNSPFSISTDGSNKSEKYYPLVATLFSSQTKHIESFLFEVPVLVGDSTGENISKLIIDSFGEKKVPLANCIALCVDNAPVMVGKHNGVAAFLKKEVNHLTVIGCPCHLIHLAAEKGAHCLPGNVDEYLVDIYYYFQRSQKRSEKFKDMCDEETKKFLKHVKTRWLSLNKCLARLLEHWEVLLVYFKEEVKQDKVIPGVGSLKSLTIPKLNENMTSSSKKRKSEDTVKNVTKKPAHQKSPFFAKDVTYKVTPVPVEQNQPKDSLLTREERIFMFLSDSLFKAVCSFLIFILPDFEKTNVQFQSNKPIIHLGRSILLNLLTETLSKFVLPSIIKNATSIKSINYHSVQNQKSDSDLVIGRATQKLVADLKDPKKCKFYSCVRNFYVYACDYMLHKFPIDDEVFINAEVANIHLIEKSSFSKLSFFIEKYSAAVLKAIHVSNEDEAFDVLQSEFCSLQQEVIPSEILEEERADIQWSLIGDLKSIDGRFKFKRLSSIMLLILSIPHSNAQCERIFSYVTKTST